MAQKTDSFAKAFLVTVHFDKNFKPSITLLCFRLLIALLALEKIAKKALVKSKTAGRETCSFRIGAIQQLAGRSFDLENHICFNCSAVMFIKNLARSAVLPPPPPFPLLDIQLSKGTIYALALFFLALTRMTEKSPAEEAQKTYLL